VHRQFVIPIFDPCVQGPHAGCCTLPVYSVAKKAFDNRTRGLEGEGFELGLLKIGIEGFFNFLVSKNSMHSDANFYLYPRYVSIYCSEAGEVEYQC